jgi:macrolide-specific efflux system membrane fusion protein
MWNKKRKIILGIGAGIMLITVLVILVKHKQNTGENFTLLNPEYGDIKTFISTTGTVQPQNRLEVKPPISGRMEEIFVHEGDTVTVGQTLAVMSSTERAALLDAARAQDEETLTYWKEVYKPTPLIAPINGKVIVRAVEPGQAVATSDAVIVLSDRLIVKAQVDETDIGKVRRQQTAIISLDAYPEVKVKAMVDHIAYESKIVNNVTIYEVDILPVKVPPIFRSGMSANIDIIEQSKEHILLLALEAIKEDNRGPFVLLAQGKNKEAVRRAVELGISDDKNVEIISGLNQQDTIIIDNHTYQPIKDSEQGRNPFMPSRPRQQQPQRRQ